MTIRQALTEATQKLKQHKIKFPHLEAEILLSHILKKPRGYLFAHPEAELTKKLVASYKLQVTKRLLGVPAAYLTGEKEFYGLKFFVNKDVLIPRPETELLVETALATARQENKPTIFIDVGTGSGCIIISIARAVISNFQFPISNFQFYATDISAKALKVAQTNARMNGVDKDINFLSGDLLSPLLNSKFKIPASRRRATASRGGQNLKLLVLANLPYLTPAQIKKSPSIKYEPRLALSAGPDGLKYYRRLFKQINKLSRPSGTPPKAAANYSLLCEIDPGQKISIRNLAKQLLPAHTIEIKKDLRGHSRLAVIAG